MKIKIETPLMQVQRELKTIAKYIDIAYSNMSYGTFRSLQEIDSEVINYISNELEEREVKK